MARINAGRAARGRKQLEFSPADEEAKAEYAQEYGRRRKGIEEEDDETQVVSKTPRLEEYYGMQRRVQSRRGPKILSSPFEKMTGGMA
jgi:hypothetical protein